MTRGKRNNNPLNIRRVVGTTWRGQAERQTDAQFVQFRSVLWGLRAAYCLLATYAHKHKAVCVEEIISRWAPPSENATKEYLGRVCRLTGYGGQERLTESQWPRLVVAMAIVESGMVIDLETARAAYQLYSTLKQKTTT